MERVKTPTKVRDYVERSILKKLRQPKILSITPSMSGFALNRNVWDMPQTLRRLKTWTQLRGRPIYSPVVLAEMSARPADSSRVWYLDRYDAEVSRRTVPALVRRGPHLHHLPRALAHKW